MQRPRQIFEVEGEPVELALITCPAVCPEKYATFLGDLVRSFDADGIKYKFVHLENGKVQVWRDLQFVGKLITENINRAST
jgi:hypothetical protein